MNIFEDTSSLVVLAATTSTFDKVIDWLKDNWVILLIIFLAIVFLIFLIVVIIPLIRKLMWKRKESKEAEKYSEDLLLRKNLSQIAQGGKEGEGAEKQVLTSYIAEIKSELSAGLKFFKSQRKNLYVDPWYAIVGEPGSGKSDLMRNSGLDFPASIVDMTQGESGTSTFHWWVSNNMVVLDIAGRILFNKWGGKGDAEWRYFISQIKKIRAKQPLNGILVTIPADSLIADDEAMVKKKAKMIADEVNVMQSTLGLCLPVYVIISKMDFVVGFRDYFSYLSTEERQAVFGWSSKDNMSFSMDELQTYFKETKSKLRKHCSSILLHNTDNKSNDGHRMNEVKSLYSFPDHFAELQTNLGQYLKILFAQTAWSGKPLLMFRGAFFTSAVDQGVELDLALAQQKQQSVEESVVARKPLLHANSFIANLFLKKIYPESNLCFFTRFAAWKRRKYYLVFSLILFSLAGFIASFTADDYDEMSAIATKCKTDWNEVMTLFKDEKIQKSPTIEINPDGTFSLSPLKPIVGLDDMSREEFIIDVYRKSMKNLKVPWIFRFSQPWHKFYLRNLYQQERQNMFQLAYAQMIYLPVVDAARFKFRHYPADKKWTEIDTLALHTLLRMELCDTIRAYNKSSYSGMKKPFSFDNLFDFVFPERAFDPNMQAGSQVYGNSLMKIGSEFNIRNPNSKAFYMLQAGTSISHRIIDSSINRFGYSWETCSAGPNLLFHDVKKVTGELKDYKDQEHVFFDIKDKIVLSKMAMTYEQGEKLLKEWGESFNKLTLFYKQLQKSEHKLARNADLSQEDLLEKTAYEFSLQMHKDYDQLTSFIVENKRYKNYNKFIDTQVLKLKKSLSMAEKNSQINLMEIDKKFQECLFEWTKLANSRYKEYKNRYFIYTMTDGIINFDDKKTDLENFDETLASTASQFDKFDKQLDDLNQKSKGNNVLNNSIDSCLDISEVAERTTRYELYNTALNSVPKSSEGIGKKIAEKSITAKCIPSPIFPLTSYNKTGVFDTSFHPDTMKRYIASWEKLEKKLVTGKNPDRELFSRDKLLVEYNSVKGLINDYKQNYVNFWGKEVLNQLDIKQFPDWGTFLKEIEDIKAYQINSSIQYLCQQSIASLNAVNTNDPFLKQIIADRVLFYRTNLSMLTEIFNKECSTCINSWQTLPNDPVSCCRSIMGMSDKDITSTLFAVMEKKKALKSLWWNHFMDTALKHLSLHISKFVNDQAQQVAQSYMFFPLCRISDKSVILSKEKIEQASLDLNRFLKIPAKPAPTGEKKKDPLTQEQELIRKLRPYYTLKRPEQQVWFEKINKVILALNESNKALYWEFILPGSDIQNKRPDIKSDRPLTPAIDLFRYFEVYADGVLKGNRMLTMFSNGKAKNINDVYGYAYEPDLTFAFYQYEGSKQPGALVEYVGHWPAVNLFLKSGVIFDDKLKIYYVPIVFTDKNDHDCYFWVGLKFNKLLPMPSQWPTPENWISFAPAKKKEEVINVNKIVNSIMDKGEVDKNIDETISRIKRTIPAESEPIWKIYLLPFKEQLRKPVKIKDENMTGYLDTPNINLKANIPDAGISFVRFVDVSVNGKKVGKRLSIVPEVETEKKVLDYRIPLDNKQVAFSFYEHSSDKTAQKSIQIHSASSILKLLSMPGVRIENDNSGFRIPFQVYGKNRLKYYIWLGVTLDYQYR